MRYSNFLLLFFLSVSAALAADLRVKVVDPHSAAVAGAQVSIYRRDGVVPIRVRTTSGDGEVVFRLEEGSALRARVLAPGFAAAWADANPSSSSPLLIKLQVAAASETVVVTATRTLAPEQETASSVTLLGGETIETMQPASFADALRFVPGAVVNVAGQRGGLGSLFVEGGDSRYNKVLVDGVPVNDPGGTFNAATVPLAETDRVEFLRGAQSTLYGSDAMTSVVQVFSRNGTTATPELRLGADGGNFGTAHGFLAVAGARSRFDYDAFADQFQSNGQGPNADYTNALQGGNLGVQLNQRTLLRVRARHSNSRTGAQGEWDFNGQRLLLPDPEQRARENDFLASAELLISSPARWQHRITGYEYNHRRLNQDDTPDQSGFSNGGCDNSNFVYIDCPFLTTAHINRAGFMYQGDYTPRSWAQTVVGYEFEDENGRFFTESTTLDSNPQNPPFVFSEHIPAIWLNHAAFVEQRVTWKRLSAIAGVRYAHHETFGDKAVPRVALTWLVTKGGDSLSGTRLRFSYATGIKEPRFEEAFANVPPLILPNRNLKAEENRAFQAGFEQGLLGGKYTVSGIYFNNQFHNQINFVVVDPMTFAGQYQNIDKSMAHGAEFQLSGRVTSRLTLNGAYVYTSSQALSGGSKGQPLLRRPKHSGNLLVTYLGSRWGANLGGSFVGRRTDSDFLGFNVNHAAGYARVDLGTWYAIHSRVTAYANVENALNDHYNEVVGYPALTANFRAGVRIRIGGE